MFRENFIVQSSNSDSVHIRHRMVMDKDSEMAARLAHTDHAQKVQRIAKGLVKAQRADKENYMPLGGRKKCEKKQSKGLKLK